MNKSTFLPHKFEFYHVEDVNYIYRAERNEGRYKISFIMENGECSEKSYSIADVAELIEKKRWIICKKSLLEQSDNDSAENYLTDKIKCIEDDITLYEAELEKLQDRQDRAVKGLNKLYANLQTLKEAANIIKFYEDKYENNGSCK